MAEILLMKSIKLILSIICYFGSGIVIVDQALEGAIVEALDINPILQTIISILLIIFLIIRILWFVWDHFYLETKERRQNLRQGAKAKEKV